MPPDTSSSSLYPHLYPHDFSPNLKLFPEASFLEPKTLKLGLKSMVAIAVTCLVWLPMASAKDFLFRNTIQLLVKTIIIITTNIYK